MTIPVRQTDECARKLDTVLCWTVSRRRRPGFSKVKHYFVLLVA